MGPTSHSLEDTIAAVQLTLLRGRVSERAWSQSVVASLVERELRDDTSQGASLALHLRDAMARCTDASQGTLSVARILQQLECEAARVVAHCRSEGIGILSVSSEDYPMELKRVLGALTAPSSLFFRGEAPHRLSKMCGVAIVGSRNPDANAEAVALRWARDLVGRGITVVSGLALGIDGASHRGAILGAQSLETVEGSWGIVPTVAVLGSGVDRVHPRSHCSLARLIVESGGFIVSQFPPGTPPLPRNFLIRNAIIAALGLGVVIVQAAAKSGAMSTARRAVDMGREVMAAPGCLWDPRFAGNNALLGEGAVLVTESDDIVANLPPSGNAWPPKSPLPKPVAEKGVPNEGGLACKVIKLLDEKGLISLAELTDLEPDPSRLVALLSHLELEGRIVRRADGLIAGA